MTESTKTGTSSRTAGDLRTNLTAFMLKLKRENRQIQQQAMARASDGSSDEESPGRRSRSHTSNIPRTRDDEVLRERNHGGLRLPTPRPVSSQSDESRSAPPPFMSLQKTKAARSTASTARSMASTALMARSAPQLQRMSVDVITLNDRCLQKLGLIGRGGSCKVYQVFDQQSSSVLALKEVELTPGDTMMRDSYVNEIELLRKLQYSNKVVKYIDHEILSDHRLLILMEKGDTDLASFLRTHPRDSEDALTPKAISFFWAEMLRCVRVIHQHGIVHSDLKPANFLIVGGNLKLIDFGIAKSVPMDQAKEFTAGTLNYMAPEAVEAGFNPNGEAKTSVRSDVWSLGVILYTMVYGRAPFAHVQANYLKMQAIVNKREKIRYPDTCKDEACLETMQLCLQRDPYKRPTVDQLLTHRYVTEGSR